MDQNFDLFTTSLVNSLQ